MDSKKYEVARELLFHGADPQTLFYRKKIPDMLKIFNQTSMDGRNGIFELAESGKENELQEFVNYPVFLHQLQLGKRIFRILIRVKNNNINF